jgi:acetyl-CoA C-acetyltransferase
VRPGGTRSHAGNASQLSDGASACVVMEAGLAAARPAAAGPLCRHGRGRDQAGRDGHRPGLRHAALLERFDLKIDDIGLWELNEAFACRSSTAATAWAFPTSC